MITEESFLDFKCPYCGDPVAFPKESAGFAQACPNCTESLIVPDDGSDVGGEIPLPITTSRLIIRRFAAHDWKDLLELMSDEEFFRYQDSVPLDEDGVLHWLESDAHVKLTTPDQTLYLGIETREGGKLIGYMGVNFPDSHRLQVTFSIGLNRQFQRQGFAHEAVVALLTFCFEGLRLHRVAGWCDSRNTAACRLLEKAGLRREGEFLRSRWSHGEWSSSIWYAILGEDYRKADSNPPQ
ncbi:MAG TPA: GNAT family N-acetyltransferase [Candidatus Paceibacterota bacterium]|nr:GNAT family N-acetyltransferase [Verrucomicrobiota bacterium]HSA12753.1 GNAT family N-acetyltransferase [Candidatus Paceibacterota bacterium]